MSKKRTLATPETAPETGRAFQLIDMENGTFQLQGRDTDTGTWQDQQVLTAEEADTLRTNLSAHPYITLIEETPA